MILNPNKVQPIVVKKYFRMKDSHALNINNQISINSENCLNCLESKQTIHYLLTNTFLTLQKSKQSIKCNTLMSLIFAGTKFRGFRGLGGHPRNLIPAK